MPVATFHMIQNIIYYLNNGKQACYMLSVALDVKFVLEVDLIFCELM
jgi:hypothetical protein